MEDSQQYQLESWIICSQSNTLRNGADTYSIDNKSMQVLLFLIQQAGSKVTKEQILEHVWKDRFVADDILSVTVSKIRKALGDNARSPTFIKTLPGEGYTLVAKVKVLDSTEHTSVNKTKSLGINISILLLLLIACLTVYFITADEGPPPNQISVNSIAVLPFDDLSPQQDNQYFTDGLSDAIINQLSQIKQLKVVSRYSSFTYRGKYNVTEIGHELQVDTLLDGSVQTIGEQVRINVRIFSTKNGQQLWSQTFDSDTQNIFELQDNISGTIQKIIQPDYSVSSKPTKKINAQAYEWYLMGQYHWRQRNPKSLAKAVTYFKNSLELEPNYAEAHVGLSITYAFLHTYGNWHEVKAIEAAIPHITKALALKPNSATALAAKGMILSDKAKYTTDIGEAGTLLYQQARQAFIHSIGLDNNATTHRWYSSLLKRVGKQSEAIQHLNQAIELNPLSASLKRTYSFLLKSMGKHDSAQRMFRRALSLEPDYLSHANDEAKMNRYTQKSVMAMAKWQAENPSIFDTCSSDEYCEQLVWSHLSIGANKVVDNLLDKMKPTHAHFRYWMNAIIASEKGDELNALSNIKRLVPQHSINRGALFDLAVAQFRASKFSLAKNTLSQLYPLWGDNQLIMPSDITADNYLALVLYAVTLSNLQEQEFGNALLRNVQVFLKQGRVFDNVQAEFTLAEINAQLNDIPQALIHLRSALSEGWIETYNKEWWSLKNNHFLQPLHAKPEFELLLKQHQETLHRLREDVTKKLSVSPS